MLYAKIMHTQTWGRVKPILHSSFTILRSIKSIVLGISVVVEKWKP